MSSYKGLIIKIQALKAHIDRNIEELKERNCYNPYCSNENYIKMQQKFSNELDNILISEKYSMEKHFKYWEDKLC